MPNKLIRIIFQGNLTTEKLKQLYNTLISSQQYTIQKFSKKLTKVYQKQQIIIVGSFQLANQRAFKIKIFKGSVLYKFFMLSYYIIKFQKMNLRHHRKKRYLHLIQSQDSFNQSQKDKFLRGSFSQKIPKDNTITNRGKWNEDEEISYCLFLSQNKKLVSTPKIRRSQKIFKSMSQAIKTRTPQQCQSHHQKTFGKYPNIKEFLKNCKAFKLKMNLAQQPKFQKFSQIQNNSYQDNHEKPDGIELFELTPLLIIAFSTRMQGLESVAEIREIVTQKNYQENKEEYMFQYYQKQELPQI